MQQALKSTDVAILASGDPLFFGIGRTLLAEFGPERIEVLPAISAMQSLCARFKVAWDDVAFVSLHGRNPGQLVAQLLRCDKTVVFTDRDNSPAALARLLLDYFAGLDTKEEAARYDLDQIQRKALAEYKEFKGL